jgi:hypothetical protein
MPSTIYVLTALITGNERADLDGAMVLANNFFPSLLFSLVDNSLFSSYKESIATFISIPHVRLGRPIGRPRLGSGVGLGIAGKDVQVLTLNIVPNA